MCGRRIARAFSVPGPLLTAPAPRIFTPYEAAHCRAMTLLPSEGRRCGQSAIGGSLLWPRDERCPICPDHDDPILGVFQLRCEEICPSSAARRAGSSSSCCGAPRSMKTQPMDPRSIRSGHGKDLTSHAAAPPAADADDGFLPRPCRIWSERVVELPGAAELESTFVCRNCEQFPAAAVFQFSFS